MRQNTVRCGEVQSFCAVPDCRALLILHSPQGTESELAGKSAACEGCPNQDVCASGAAAKGPDPALPFVRERMTQVNRKILVLSGKGGVGKSTFSAQLGWAFASDPDVQVRAVPPSSPPFFLPLLIEKQN